jgi:DNA-3-methyladenine glycosylase
MVYGMYHCLNVVTGREGVPGAVLIRAVRPCEGLDGVRTDGPGKLCRAFGLDMTFHGRDMCGPPLYVERARRRRLRVGTGPRVGVDYAGPWKDKPWRFFVRET